MKIGNIKISLWQQVLIALCLGIVTGLIMGPSAKPLGHFGIVFLNLIKMVTVPMILFTIIYGITTVEGTANLYRISYKIIAVFITTSFIAVSIGLVTSNIMQPGNGLSASILEQFQTSSQLPKVHDNSVMETLINLIPTNIFMALAEGNILQIIVFGFLLGAVLQSKRNECKHIITVVHEIAGALFKIIQIIMYLSPLGVFGYIASIVGMEGISILFFLGKLILTVLIGCILQYLLYGILILFVGRMSPLPFYRKMLGPQMIAFATSSSKATLVPLMEMSEVKLGVSKQKSRFLLPLSAALHMDGGAIYQSSCAIFFAQMMGVDFTISQYVTLFLMCTLASVGGAGIPGGVLLFLGMVLHSVGLPIEGVLLVATVDRILDMITTVLNVTGGGFATVLVDKSEGTLNTKIYNNTHLAMDD